MRSCSRRPRPGALQSAPTYRASGNARGWLFAIANNKLADSARRHAVADRSRRELGMAAVELTADDLERAEELLDAQRLDIETLLQELPSEQRDALQARIVDERDYRELAIEWSCSEAVIRQRVSRGLSALRRRLGAVA